MANREMAPRCDASLRPATLRPDKLLMNAGWRLFGAAEVFGDVTVARALAGYDGMCRPFQYQGFVFYQDRLVGTLSPLLMDARTDGSLRSVTINGTQIYAEFVRYTAKDPLCCPSASTGVWFELDAKGARPRLVPVSAATTKSGTP